MRNAYIIFIEYLNGRDRYEDGNTRINLRTTEWQVEAADWVHLAHDRDQHML
jgi:hypothetical protein